MSCLEFERQHDQHEFLCFGKRNGTLLQRGPIVNSPKSSLPAIFRCIELVFQSQSAGRGGWIWKQPVSLWLNQANIKKDSSVSLAFFTFFVFIMVCHEFSDVSFHFEAGIWSSRHGRNGLFQSGHSCWLAPILAFCHCFGCLSRLLVSWAAIS